MHVAILHQTVPANASADEQDVLVQVEAVATALRELGHSTSILPCDLDLSSMIRNLRELQPDLAVNLVESLSGTDSLQSLVPLVLETLPLPFTGSPGAVILNTGRKPFAKSLMRESGLPTPIWFDENSTSLAPDTSWADDHFPGRYILKPMLEHASVGMTDADVVSVDSMEFLIGRLKAKNLGFGRPCFAEAYVEGREFNLSLLEKPGGVDVLPAAEIRFIGFPPGKPKIVGSAAKWAEASFEYSATVRSFDLRPDEQPLIQEMSKLALFCWRLLGLRGYARVDFRTDEQGRPWILEANANPCLSPDAGFAAAAEQAGISFREVVRRIVESAN
jgi:D-alanine-D-alanine ligase